MSTDDAIRASDADREHAVGMLRDGYATGRLTLAEFDDRTTAALTSRTWGELRGLTRDLPAPGQRVLPPPAPREALGRSERLPAAALADRGPGLTPILLIAVYWLTLTFTAHAAGLLIPVVFPISEAMGINSVHFDIVQTAAVGIGLFLPPMGVGLLMALRFANLSVGQHFRTYIPYMLALFAGLILIICIPEISLTLPRLAGLIR